MWLARMVVTAILASMATTLLGGEVADSPNMIRPMLVGNSIPILKVKDADGKPVDIKQLAKGKPTILVYYRGGWCPFCTQQLTALGKKRQQLQKLGFQLIAVSADKPSILKTLSESKGLGFTMYSDNTMEGAKALGIAFRVPKSTVKLYKERFRIDIEKSSGLKHDILPVPAVFVLDKKSVIAFEYVNPNYKVRLDEDVLMAAAKAALRN